MLRMALCLVAPLLLGWTACGDRPKEAAPLAPGDSGQVATDTVRFADPGLERAVRLALGDSVGVLSAARVSALTQLEAKGQGILSLEGIGQLRGLISLNLQGNRISDLSPLIALPALRYLDLSGNQVQDLTPLADVPKLLNRVLTGNPLGEEARTRVIPELRSKGVSVTL